MKNVFYILIWIDYKFLRVHKNQLKKHARRFGGRPLDQEVKEGMKNNQERSIRYSFKNEDGAIYFGHFLDEKFGPDLTYVDFRK